MKMSSSYEGEFLYRYYVYLFLKLRILSPSIATKVNSTNRSVGMLLPNLFWIHQPASFLKESNTVSYEVIEYSKKM